MTQTALLTAKIQCAEEGRRFEGANPISSSNFFDITYSPRLNTCIVLRQQIAADGTDTMDILDILNNGRILDTATTTSTKRSGTATYQLWKSLFNEANLEIDFNKPGATTPALPLLPGEKPQ
jgi:hypothetical protein